MAPSSTSAWTSARMSPGRRSFSLPRRAGTMQNVHVLLQPTEMDTQPEYTESRLVGSVEGKTSRDSRISSWASLLWRARSSSAGRAPDVVRAEDRVHPRRLLQDGFAVLLRQAPADGDLHARVGCLDRRQHAEVAVELVVRVLPHGARVEDDDVGLVALRRNVAGGLEHAGHPLGIVDVHLAAEGAHLVGAGLRRQASAAAGTVPDAGEGMVRLTR